MGALEQPDLLRLDHVTVQRGGKRAINNMSLRIPQGQHVAVLGPNGSGKSTLLKLLTREIYPLYAPESQISILGQSVWDVFELRSRLGIVSPDMLPNLARGESGWDLIISSFFTSIGLQQGQEPSDEMRRRTAEVVHRLHIASATQRTLQAMSSGEARRCLLARALVHRPHTLLLDEPTTSLDLPGRRDFLAILSGLADAGHSIVLVTHHTGEVLPQIERVVLLRDGQIFRDGPKAGVLRSEVLSELFGTPITVSEKDGYYHAW